MEKVLILLLYYDRPNMVVNAIESIKNLESENWELVFIDDGSLNPGKPIVEKILPNHLDKIKFVNTGDSIEDKQKQGGSKIGLAMNSAINSSDATIAIMLCDDDTLVSDYLTNLSKWFTDNPKRMYCYSHVILFDPFEEKPDKSLFVKNEILWDGHKQNRYKNRYNKKRQLNPANGLDSSQVAWKISCNKEGIVWFPYPKTANLDAKFYGDLCAVYGQITFSGFTRQYKGYHVDNLCLRDIHTRSTHHQRRNSIIFAVKDLEPHQDTTQDDKRSNPNHK